MSIKTYTRYEQERILRKYNVQATYRMTALLHRKRDLLAELAIERAMGLGFDRYGSSMFQQSYDELERETLEELADGINRQCVYSARERGDLQ